VAAFAVGGMFILVQTLSSQGYLQVNHEKIQREVEVSSFGGLVTDTDRLSSAESARHQQGRED
jgi:hypothetical protein